jgi:hypothetical protein
MPTGTIALFNVGPGSKGPENPGPGPGSGPLANVTAVWGYVGTTTVEGGLAGLSNPPTQTTSPLFSCGVYGQGEGAPGVVGANTFVIPSLIPDASGDGVVGFGTNGVRGYGTTNGVLGTSTSGAGVSGTSSGADGVYGESTSNQHAGVYGINNSTSAGTGGWGVYGSSKGCDGVHGECQSSQHAGVSGINTAGGYGIYAQSVNQSIKGSPAGTAGIFLGDVEIQGDITSVNNIKNIQGNVKVTGTLTALVDVVLGSDCAEDFDIVSPTEIDPGTVMVLTDSGALEPSQDAYDKKVAGVISGAGDYRPGLILGRCESSQERMPLALVGKVYCKVDADPAPIGVGDLLTTSARAGFGMKATDSAQAFGAVIGKALKPLRAGQGMIPILVALQ